VAGEQEWNRNLALSEVFDPREVLQSGQNGRLLFSEYWTMSRHFIGLDKELFFSFVLHLPEHLLVKVDRASMAWALEARSPLLDREFVEFCARIPASRKIAGPNGKLIFRSALKAVLPEEILTRKKKGFIPPMSSWLREELRPLIEDLVLRQDSVGSRLVGGHNVQRLVDEHLSGRANHERRLYALLNLELWHNTFIRRGV
jgi:asparagine synthase (glutamine-hydrolysing)